MHKHIIQTKNIGIILLATIILSSCYSSQKVAYFQNAGDSSKISSLGGLEPLIQADDILSIKVSSLSSEAAVLFNTPNMPLTQSQASNPSMPQTAGYLVNKDGNIQFPVLGSIQALGLTPNQLEEKIAGELVKRELLFDPVVNARFLNYRVTVLGEVNRPGVVYANGEQINILEAIGLAGDLTIYGLRDNVLLIRQEGAEKIIKRFDLTSTKILTSPYFYLKSNDVLYVEPGKNRIASTDATLRILPVVFSGVSVIVVVLNSLLK